MAEQPTVPDMETPPEPKGPQVPSEPKAPVQPELQGGSDINELINKLGQLGVETPQQLDNMSVASQQAGRLANEIGNLRQEVQNLRSNPATQPLPQYQEDPYGDSAGLTAQQIVQMVENGVRAGVRSEMSSMMQQQTQAQQQVMSELTNIRGDKRYAIVKDQWENHIKDPMVQQRVMSGQVTATQEYQNLVIDTLTNVAVRLKDAVVGASQGQQAGGIGSPPNLEGAQPGLKPNHPGELAPLRDRLVESQKGSRGDNASIESMIDAAFPQGDNFFDI